MLAVDYSEDPRALQIAEAAKSLLEERDNWLNPPEWVDWIRTPAEEAAGFPLRAVPRVGHEDDLRVRTLTNLYNTKPTWLSQAHGDLDRAVANAYGWEWPLDEEEILSRLFELNVARQGATGALEGAEE